MSKVPGKHSPSMPMLASVVWCIVKDASCNQHPTYVLITAKDVPLYDKTLTCSSYGRERRSVSWVWSTNHLVDHINRSRQQ